MRKKIKRILASIMAFAILATSILPSGLGGFNKDVVKAYASTEGEENVNEEVSVDWSYELLEDGTIEITGCEIYYDETAEEVNIVIPSQIDGYDVTSIGDDAFEWKDYITSIEIPSSVTNIGNWAFWSCDSLTSIEIPSSVTNIGNQAFDDCDSLTSIEIPSSVISIGASAFEGCSSLTSIQVDENNEVYDSRNNCNAIIETASNTLIQGCNNSIIPSDIIIIGDYAFSNLNGLASIEIPSSVTNIGDGAFFNCDSLTSIEIPTSITSIGSNAFYDCDNLTSVELLANITSIGGWVFTDCDKLSNVKISSGITELGDGMFADCYNLSSIEIPTSVTSIGDYAFEGCSKLVIISSKDSYAKTFAEENDIQWQDIDAVDIANTTISFADTEYNYDYDGNCKTPGITVTYEDSTLVEETDYNVSYSNNTYPGTAEIIVEGIGNYKGKTTITFEINASSLYQPVKYYFDNSTTQWDEVYVKGYSSFDDNKWAIDNGIAEWPGIKLETDVETGYYVFQSHYAPGDEAYITFNNGNNEQTYSLYALDREGKLYIPENTEDEGYWNGSWNNLYGGEVKSGIWTYQRISADTIEITGCEIYYDETAEEVNIFIPSQIDGYDVTSIGDSAFESKGYITSIEIPTSVTNIGNYAFYNCDSLTSIEIPTSVTNIGIYAFDDCESLTSIEIPSSVTSIGDGAFISCNSLLSIQVDENNEVYDSRNNCNAIIETASNTLIQGCNNSIIPSDIIIIGDEAFSNLDGLASIEIPTSVTSIGDGAFWSCNSLTSIEIPSSVTSIGNDAFLYCNGLINIQVNENNEVYDSRNNCNAIIETESNTLLYGCKNTVIPSDINIIGSDAFANCVGLTNVEIPLSVTSIGAHAFDECENLSSVEIPTSVTNIGNYAFYNCESLTSIEIPSSVTSIGYWVFSNCDKLSNVKISSGITELGYGMFASCYNLSSIEIPTSVTSIGDYAFEGCSKLVIICSKDSYAKTFAEENDIQWQDINGVDIANTTISFADTEYNYDYDGNCKTPGITVTHEDSTLVEGTDYKVSYSNNTYPGTAEIIVEGIENYKGKTTITFEIKASSLYQPVKYYFDNSTTQWDEVYVQGYSSFDDNKWSVDNGIAEWPGIKLETDVETGYYVFQSHYAPGDEAYITFNNGNNEQTYSLYALDREGKLYIPENTEDEGYWNGSWNKLYGGPVTSGIWTYERISSDEIEIISCNDYYEFEESNEIIIPSQIDGYDVVRIGNEALTWRSGITSVKISEGIKSIGEYAFYYCDNLISVEIPSTVIEIGENAFYGCNSLVSIEIDENNEVYDSRNNCNAIIETESNTLVFGFANTTIPIGVTSIGEKAFYNCDELTSIEIPSSVTSIGDGAFISCNSLLSIQVDENNEVYDSRDNCNAIIETVSNKLIQGCKNTIIPSSVTSIGEKAFYDCDKLTSIEIPSSVTSIGERAFSDCDYLTSIRIPSSVANIGVEAFYACSGLTSIEISSGVTSIGEGAFRSCFNLISIQVDENNEVYDSRDNCNAIIETESNTLIQGCQNTLIPSNVTNIGNYAFNFGEKEIELEIPSSVTSISYNAFYDSWEFTIVSSLGSYAQTYAEENGYKWINVDAVKISDAIITFTDPEFNYDYDGTRKRPEITVTYEGNTLLEEVDYTITYSKNKYPGTAKITVEGIGNYRGETTLTFVINTSELYQPVKYYFDNSVTQWDNVSVWCWSVEDPEWQADNEFVAWPGIELQIDEETGYYVYECPNPPSNCDAYVMFNNGGEYVSANEQTNDASAFASGAEGKVFIPTDLDEDGQWNGEWENLDGTERIDISSATITLDETEFECDGTAKTPGVTVVYEDNTLTEGIHYKLTYSKNVLPGKASVTVVGIGDYKGRVVVDFTINQGTFETVKFYFDNSLTQWDEVYVWCWSEENMLWLMENGFDCWPGIKLDIDEETGYYKFECLSIPETDLYLHFNNGCDEQTSDLTAYAIDNIGKVLVPVELDEEIDWHWNGTWEEINTNRIDISENAIITLDETEFDCDGTRKTPGVTVTYEGNTLVAGTDYRFAYSNNLYPGVGKVTVTGIGEYKGNVVATFAINPGSFETVKFYFDNSVTQWDNVSVWCWSDTDVLWQLNNGFECWPGIELQIDEETGFYVYECWSVPDVDFNVMFNNGGEGVDATEQTNDTSAYAIGNEGKVLVPEYLDINDQWQGSWENVEKPVIDINNAEIILSEIEYVYDGNAKTPTLTVKYDGKVLTENEDYVIEYRNNVYSGTATVVVTGKGKYVGEVDKIFNILPTNVTGFTCSSSSSSAVDLKWTQNTSATGYVIEQYKDGAWVEIATITSNATVSYKVAGLSASTTYKFRIKAYKTIGDAKLYSGYVETSINTLPTDVTGFTCSSSLSNSISLKWTQNTSATGYVIEQYKDGAWVEIATITSNATVSHKVTGLSASTTYKFRIKAYKTIGDAKLYSGYVETSVNTLPTNVTGLTYSARTSNSISLKWTKNTSASGYVIQQYKGGKWVTVKTITSNGTVSHKVTGLSAAKTYKFRIKAYKTINGVNHYSGYTSVSVNTLPTNVTGFKYSESTSSSVSLKWTKNTSASGYVIQQYKGGKWVTVKTITSNGTVSHKVTGLSASKTYKFRIKAYKTINDVKHYSGYTETSVNTLPSNVKGFTYSARTKNSITLKWTKNTSASGYVIQQYKGGKWKTIKTITKNSTVSYKVTGLSASKTYKFRIKAYKGSGTSKLYSGDTTKSINTLPSNVKGFTYSARTKNSITLKWTKNTSASGYVIQQYKGGKWVTIKTITKNSTVSYKVTRLKKATSYKFRIKAYDKDGGTKLYSSYVTKTIKTK